MPDSKPPRKIRVNLRHTPLERLIQEANMRQKNIELYLATSDPRLKAEQDRLAELKEKITALTPPTAP